jgi:glycerol uptake facilitator-like aquaporin
VQDRGPAAYIAEFIGTAALVFFITAVVSNFNTAASAQNPNPFIDWSVIGLAHVLILFVLIQTLALISGAHFNPAITAALTVLRQIKPPDAGIYILAQLAGGVAGALLTKGLLTDFANASSVHFGATAVSGRLGDKTGRAVGPGSPFRAEVYGAQVLVDQPVAHERVQKSAGLPGLVGDR